MQVTWAATGSSRRARTSRAIEDHVLTKNGFGRGQRVGDIVRGGDGRLGAGIGRVVAELPHPGELPSLCDFRRVELSKNCPEGNCVPTGSSGGTDARVGGNSCRTSPTGVLA